MSKDLSLIYEGAPLSGVNSGVIYAPILRDCNLQRVDILTDEIVTGDVVFFVTKNGVLIEGTTLTVSNGTRIEQSAALDVDLVFGDELELSMQSGSLNPPITLNLVVDYGEAGGVTAHSDLTGLDADDHPQYFNQTRGDARYVQSTTLIETIQDTVGAMLLPGSHASISYNDAAGTVSIDSVQLTQEEIEDRIGALLAGGANTTVTYNDGGNVLTIAETAAGMTQEQIEDIVGGLLAGGSNITLTYNDAVNSLTIAASAGGGGSTVGTIATATYTTASIADTVTENGTVNLAKSYQLLKVVGSVASRVRVYSSSALRTSDAARAIGTLPTGQHGVVQESVLTSTALTDNAYPKPFGANDEAVRSSSIPVAIQNRSGITQAVTITFTYLILEA
jgi:hypothetical protein